MRPFLIASAVSFLLTSLLLALGSAFLLGQVTYLAKPYPSAPVAPAPVDKASVFGWNDSGASGLDTSLPPNRTGVITLGDGRRISVALEDGSAPSWAQVPAVGYVAFVTSDGSVVQVPAFK